MAKRSASSESDKLIKELMPLRDDPGKVYEALARQDLATISVVVAKLLDTAAAVEATESAKRHKPVCVLRSRMTVRQFHLHLILASTLASGRTFV